jgi:hypothetical protein
MNKRKYHFELPYTIPYMYVTMGIGRLQNEGVYDSLPTSLKERLESCDWNGVTITEADCNEIDDDAWASIAEKLDLDWE